MTPCATRVTFSGDCEDRSALPVFCRSTLSTSDVLERLQLIFASHSMTMLVAQLVVAATVVGAVVVAVKHVCGWSLAVADLQGDSNCCRWKWSPGPSWTPAVACPMRF